MINGLFFVANSNLNKISLSASHIMMYHRNVVPLIKEFGVCQQHDCLTYHLIGYELEINTHSHFAFH